MRDPDPSYQTGFIINDSPPELPAADRPKARLLRDGPDACSTVELIQVILGGAPSHAERAARTLLDQCNGLRGIAACSVLHLAQVAHGVGMSKAAQIKASIELGKRALSQADEPRPQIKTPADAARLLIPHMSLLDQEEVRTMQLDTRNRLISIVMTYRGSLNAVGMRMGEVFKEAIRCNAASIVISHNHPSGDPTPSAEDIAVTETIAQAGKLLDCELLDHIVIGQGGQYVSLKERGLGFDR